MKTIILTAWLSVVAAIGSYATALAQTTATGYIVAVMMKEFDRPDARLTVEPVVIDDDIAIASWIQDSRGGRALLRRKGDAWNIALCSGESLRQIVGLTKIGIDEARAKRLADSLERAENALPKSRIALFDSFEGTVVMDEHGNHPQSHEAEDHERGQQHAQHIQHGGQTRSEPGQHHQHGQFDDAEKWTKTFDDPKRDEWQKPDEILKALALKPGDVVADLGAGTGFLAARIARSVPEGKVFAADLSKDMVAFLGKRAQENKITNLVAVQASELSPNLPEKVNVAIMLDVYHHIGKRVDYFKALQSSLKPDARVAVIDFRPDSPEGAPKHMRLPISTVESEMSAAGYRRIAAHDFLPRQYFLVFEAKI